MSRTLWSLQTSLSALCTALLFAAAGCGTFTDAGESLDSVACNADPDCPGGQVCGPEGYCVVAPLVVDEPCDGACTGAEVCDEASDTCVCAGGVACSAGEVCCAGEGCLDVLADAANCGACGVTCGEGESCVGGICTCGEQRAGVGAVAVCAAPSVCCDGRCADPRFDAQCCGTLAAHVDCGDQLCASGVCECAAGTATCGGGAECGANLLDDPTTCGSCENDCGMLACIGGSCSCGGIQCSGAGQACCGTEAGATVCVDTSSSRQHCGECGSRCGPGEACVASQCGCGGGAPCTGGQICCGGACLDPSDPGCLCGASGMACLDAAAPDCCGDSCTDLSTDAMNCGECGMVCGAGQECSSGSCVCSDPQLSACADGCVDLLGDEAHCGGCGVACGGGETCCSGQCTDLASDLLNCGACGSFCGGEGCADGQCSCGGTPVNLDIDPDNCGQCSRTCVRPRVSGAVCVSGTCRYQSATCEAGWGDCNSDKALDGCEVDLASNDQHCGACDAPCTAPASCAAGQCVTTDRVVEVGTGTNHTCARRQSGLVECWGASGQGQVGNGAIGGFDSPQTISGSHVAVDLAVGWDHSCIATQQGDVYCWGENSHGEVGVSTLVASSRSVPTQVGGLSGATRVAAGLDHSCAIVAGGEVWCWGRNDKGQVGSDAPRLETSVAVRAGTLTGAVDLGAGEKHTCAVLGNGEVWCWGEDANGRIGDDGACGGGDRTEPCHVATLSNLIEVDLGLKFSLAVDGQNTLWGWGANDSGQLLGASALGGPPVQLATGVVSAAAGNSTSCTVQASGGVQCWGNGTSGQLGDGNTSSTNTPVQVSGLSSGAVAVDVAVDHACAVMAADAASNPGGVKCWGKNTSGKLGRGPGNTSDSTTPVDVVSLP